MLHRHLDHQRFTLAAIDDVISRGRWREWAELRRAALSDRTLLDKVERVWSCAAGLQRILPDAVLVGGTASAIHAEHRFSRDADHVLTDLRHRFDEVSEALWTGAIAF